MRIEGYRSAERADAVVECGNTYAGTTERCRQDAGVGACLAVNIVRLRQEREMTKCELAELVRITRPTLDRLESGDGDPRISLVGKLSRAFDTPIEELLSMPKG